MLSRPRRSRGLVRGLVPLRAPPAQAAREWDPPGVRRSRGSVHGLLALTGFLGAACSSAPPYSGWTEDQLYEQGVRAFEAGDWGEARRAFERLVLAFPLFDRTVEARHYLARAFYEDGQYVSAVSEFTRIAQIYPDHERARDAWMGLCRSYAAMSPHPERDAQPTVDALNTCRNVANDFRGTPVGDSAAVVEREMTNRLGEKAFRVGQFYFRQDVYESAEIVFNQLVAEYPDTDAAPRALVRLIRIYEEWGWDDDAEDIRTRLLDEYPDSPEARALDRSARGDTVSIVMSRAPPVPRSPPAWSTGAG